MDEEANTRSPRFFSLNSEGPKMELSSTIAVPSSTRPSIGNTMPARTQTVLSASMDVMNVLFNLPFVRTSSSKETGEVQSEVFMVVIAHLRK